VPGGGVIKSGTSLGAHASGVLCSRARQTRWKRALPGQTALSNPTFNYTRRAAGVLSRRVWDVEEPIKGSCQEGIWSVVKAGLG
jgi:hypothetical protein